MTALLRAWLLAWLLAVGLGLGCLILLMLDHLVRGRWGDAVRPALESGARSLLWWSLGFVPIVLGVERLYPWTDVARMASDPVLQHKAAYLSEGGFAIRGVVCLLGWSGLALALTQSPGRRRGVAAFGLIFVFSSMTVVAVDWVASLEPRFSSSAFGLALLTGQIVAALAMANVIAAVCVRLRPAVAHDLGNLSLATLLLWAYIAFTQFLLVWSADLPSQSAWYLARGSGPWLWVIVTIVLVRLGVCLPALLLRPVKRNPRWLALVGLALIVSAVLELYWFVIPGAGAPHFGWLDIVIPVVALMLWPSGPTRAMHRRGVGDG